MFYVQTDSLAPAIATILSLDEASVHWISYKPSLLQRSAERRGTAAVADYKTGTRSALHREQLMTIGLTTAVRPPQSFEGIGSTVARETPHSRQRLVPVVAWVTLLGILFPPIDISPGVIHLTPGRFVVILLLIPALRVLLRSGRSRVATDFFAIALSTWMLVASAFNGGFKLYVVAEALEFLSAYLIGRAFFFGPFNLQAFLQALKGITIVIIAIGLADTLSGRSVTLESLGIVRPLLDLVKNFRFGLTRATSVFPEAEHYGTFCVAAASIFFYSERGIRRIFYVGLCFFGCMFALSSGPMLALGLVTTAFFYDRILKHYSWRWKPLMIIVAGLIPIAFLISNDPMGWIFSHMTFDAQTGWFRLATWSAALPLVGQSPFVGHGFSALGDSAQMRIYLGSVDCVWLVEALRYGLPAVILLTLVMFSAILRRTSIFNSGIYMLPTGFSLAIVAMGLIGLTVHLWDSLWLFLSLCIGIRASLGEYEAQQRRLRAAASARS